MKRFTRRLCQDWTPRTAWRFPGALTVTKDGLLMLAICLR